MSRQLQPVESLLSKRLGTYTHEYTERDLALYALGLRVYDLRYVYEIHPSFAALPTFAVIPAFPASYAVPMEQYLPNFDRAKALHGEQYVELKSPLPSAAQVSTSAQVVDVQDKGSGAVVVLRTVSTDMSTGHELAVNEFTTFVMGAGGFTGVQHPLPRPPAAVAANKPPERSPDVVVEVETDEHQAALYRLSGDYNPLHIDRAVSKRAGFPQPILHGLATFGMSVRQVLLQFGGDDPNAVSSIKVRFAKHVYPGDSLVVEMWQISNSKVVFQTRVKGRGDVAISNAAVEFHQGKLVQSSRKDSSSSSSKTSKL